jgi:adenylate cyclase
MNQDPIGPEARAALKRETRATFFRSMGIAIGFALPYSVVQAFAMRPEYRVPVWVAVLSFGLPMGVLMPLMHLHLLDRARHRSFALTVVRQSFLYVLTIGAALSISLFGVIAWHALRSGSGIADAVETWARILTHPLFLASLPLGLLMVLPIRFFFALSQKLGPGVLGKWLRGYYHEPREEERIFMFLDMKDSTALAERLGNLKFSALVRDFFEDLTLPVLQTKAEVSHYIGDEAVLTWTMPAGLERANCLRLFFEFEKSISGRAGHYEKTYGLVPGFKAGAHCGKVIATEVGEVKSEIVFHGDVLNTAARIQGQCNGLGEGFLVSEELLGKLAVPDEFEARALGAFDLKGKEAEVSLVAIRRRT